MVLSILSSTMYCLCKDPWSCWLSLSIGYEVNKLRIVETQHVQDCYCSSCALGSLILGSGCKWWYTGVVDLLSSSGVGSSRYISIHRSHQIRRVHDCNAESPTNGRCPSSHGPSFSCFQGLSQNYFPLPKPTFERSSCVYQFLFLDLVLNAIDANNSAQVSASPCCNSPNQEHIRLFWFLIF